MTSFCTVLLSLMIPTFSTYTGYTYGDHVSGYKWSAVTPLATYNNIATASVCEGKCEQYGTICNNWAWRSSNNKCVIGKDGQITQDSDWTAGWNKNSCDNPLDCSQNTVCTTWSNEAFSVSGSKRILTSNSDTRCYKAYVPDECKNNVNDKCKVVFSFSSFATDAIAWSNQRIAFTERITGEASIDGWVEPGIVIFPQRYAKVGGWHFLPGRAGLCNTYNDVKFVADILYNLENDNNIYWNNVYAMGYDNGGHFLYDLAGRLSGDENIPLTAIGTYSSNSLTDHGGTVEPPSTPLSILIVQGYNDLTHPYWGHTSTGCDMGRDDSRSLADWWAQQLNCDPTATIDECHILSGTAPNCIGTDGEKKRHYTNCDNNVKLELQSTNTDYSFTSSGDIAFPDFFKDL